MELSSGYARTTAAEPGIELNINYNNKTRGISNKKVAMFCFVICSAGPIRAPRYFNPDCDWSCVSPRTATHTVINFQNRRGTQSPDGLRLTTLRQRQAGAEWPKGD